MGNIFEEIEINGKKISAKIDTASDFPLVLKRETIDELKLIPSGKATIFTPQQGKKEVPIYFATLKIRGCLFGAPQIVVESHGRDNILGHPVLQALNARIDEENHKVEFDMEKCPYGSAGGIEGEII